MEGEAETRRVSFVAAGHQAHPASCCYGQVDVEADPAEMAFVVAVVVKVPSGSISVVDLAIFEISVEMVGAVPSNGAAGVVGPTEEFVPFLMLLVESLIVEVDSLQTVSGFVRYLMARLLVMMKLQMVLEVTPVVWGAQ